MHEEMIIAGFGGQGILFGAKVLAQAAMMEKKEVVMNPSYGAEVRGGTAHAGVIIDTHSIGSPLILSPDALIILNQQSLVRFARYLNKDGLLLVNTSLVGGNIEGFKKSKTQTIIGIPATEIAEAAGNAKAANIVMLGRYVREHDVIPLRSIKSALQNLLKEKPALHMVNEKALEKGYNY